MVDEHTRNARLDLIRAQTEHLRVDSALKQRELDHKNASDNLRIYHFPSFIIPESIDTCIEIVQHWLSMSDAPVTIALNSPGGSVFEGWALYDFIADRVEEGVAIDVTTYGKCASMAAVVLQAGRVRSMHRHSYFMVHEVSAFLEGMLSVQSMKNQLKFSEDLQHDIETVLVSRANPDKITKEQLHDKSLNRDWWLTAAEALDYGFIDHIAK